jgi:putative cardiolipin synthase
MQRSFKKESLALLLTSLLFLFTACGNTSPQPEKVSLSGQNSVTPDKHSPLLKYLSKTDKKLAGNSAFYPLPLPMDALAARLFLVDKAKSTLDVQYYIFENDTIGTVFTAHLLKAAQRGVKVRILLDDMGTTGKDSLIQAVAAHPNIDLHLFNPNMLRTSFRNMALILDVEHLGKRMHNKALIADGMAAIIGGRNIGDVYFASSPETLFLDYDVLTVGEVVRKLNKEFALYWNSPEVESSKKVLTDKNRLSKQELEKIVRYKLDRFEKSNIGKQLANSSFKKKIAQKSLVLTVAKSARLYYDHPSKVSHNESNSQYHISSQLSRNLKRIKKSAIIISPYFIPSEKMLKTLKQLREKGVEVTVLTNSLSATDVPPVYAGYQGSIKPLLEMGIKLYEVKSRSFDTLLQEKGVKQLPSISLHTKMIVLDDNRLIVGSANLDPRSNKLNTELIVIIDSKKLARRHRDALREIINTENMYQLSLQKGHIVWKTMEEGKMNVYLKEPHTTPMRRLGTDIMSLLPIKGYL